MADPVNGGFSLGQAGQPATPSVPAQATPAPVTPVQEQPAQGQETPDQNSQQPVTKEEVRQMIAELQKQNQSQNDKLQARITKQIDSMSKAGITATPEQVQKMIAAEDQAQSQTPVPQVTPAQVQPAASQQNDPVTTKAIQIVTETCGELLESDPESQFVLKTTDPEEFLQSVRAAAAKKASRLKAAGTPARIPTMANGASSNIPAHAGKSGIDTINDYLAEKFGM